MKSSFHFNFGEMFSDDETEDGNSDDTECNIGDSVEEIPGVEEETKIRRREMMRKTKMFRDFDKNLDRVTCRAKELENLFKRAVSVSTYGASDIQKRTNMKVMM